MAASLWTTGRHDYTVIISVLEIHISHSYINVFNYHTANAHCSEWKECRVIKDSLFLAMSHDPVSTTLIITICVTQALY